MLNKMVFQETERFYIALDLAIQNREPIEISFASNPPNQQSDLWKRLGRCKGWSSLIAIDFMLARPEFMPPNVYADAFKEIVPLVANSIHFHQYLKYKIYTQQVSAGSQRRILLRPK